MNVVADRPEWANGVLLRALALPGEPEQIAAGRCLLSGRFGIDRKFDALSVLGDCDLWLAPRPAELIDPDLVTTTRIGVSQGEHLPLRWYLKSSRSISKRARGDRSPKPSEALRPSPSWAPELCASTMSSSEVRPVERLETPTHP